MTEILKIRRHQGWVICDGVVNGEKVGAKVPCLLMDGKSEREQEAVLRRSLETVASMPPLQTA